MAIQLPIKFEFAYKNEYSMKARKFEAERVVEKFPDRIPLILERHHDSKLHKLDKKQ